MRMKMYGVEIHSVYVYDFPFASAGWRVMARLLWHLYSFSSS